MLPVADGLEIVLQRCRPLPPVLLALPAALSRVLAEEIASDVDSPPFDKALMDGYAVRCADLHADSTVMPVAGEVMAGQVPAPLPAGRALRIMTGAPIPPSAEAVVRVEQTQLLDDGRVVIAGPPPLPGQNILPRGQEMRRGDAVLHAGFRLNPQAIGVLASVGRTAVLVHPPPRLAIAATGNELVEPSAVPGPGQLRNSNANMLVSQAIRGGADTRYLGIALDSADALAGLIEVGLQSDVLVLSGGVSAGKLDLVPGVLRDMGVQPHFHQIAMKPGKPLYFGTRGATLVFGLPGNPVSSFCCFELFVRPALRQFAGYAEPRPQWQRAALVDSFRYQTERPTYHPAVIETVDGHNRVRRVEWFGSPDLRAVTAANALTLLAPGANEYTAGQWLPVLALD